MPALKETSILFALKATSQRLKRQPEGIFQGLDLIDLENKLNEVWPRTS